MSLCGSSFAFLILNWEQNKIEGMIKVRIPKGKTLKEITAILSEKDIVKSDRSFMLAVRSMGYEKDLQAGNLILHEPQTNFRLIRQLVYGMPELIKITILEGWNIQKVAETLENRLGIHREKVTALCMDRWFIRSMAIKAPTLEGFLFPETYYFVETESPRTILRKMVSEYQDNMSDEMKIRAEELGLSELQLITLASIIEGEAIYDKERKNISSVYHNRLNRGMRLQADPTIQYIIKDGPRRLLNNDLNIKSPYNTYLNYGLPPGPINNPGLKSILAALYPAESDYIYFVARGDGYHTFSQTQEEHNSAKRKLNRLRKKIKRERNQKGKG
jgi:UPF0755 protein